MANSFESNFTRMLARVFLEKFESARVLSKNVDTQLLAGKFAPNTGDTVDFKRPTDYVSRRTATGDVSSGALKSDIITGKASGVVQDYFTVFVDYDEADEAIKMDQLDQLLAPMATRIVTDMELDFAAFMLKNTALVTGTVGSPILTWDDVAAAGALMAAAGIPSDSMWNYALNPFTQRTLASDQRSLGAGGVAGGLIDSAHKRAIITDNFAGMKVMMATTLASFTTPTTGDVVGAMNGAPDVTYLTAKDTMTQVLAVTGFGAFGGVVPAGTVLEITGVNRLNLNTRQPIIDELGANVIWRCVVQTDATLAGGAGNITVTGPGIFETGGQYNTTDVAIGAANVVTILNADATLFQPNVFWHRQAFGIGSVPIKKLHSTDTLATTEDGMQMRVSKGVGFLENNQKVRFDFRPAYAAFNPFFAGQGWGTP
jgi:hypothetical protein